MKISALRLFNVKRFAGRGVALEGIDDGVNVLCAANEFGKSTSFEALHALFFQPHTSVSADVRNLRPYSGGSPLVEADIQTAEGLFRITKQYYGGRSARVTDLATTRLVAQADEAENFIANLIRGGAAGPAGLLWVRQGVTGIEKRTRTEEDGEKEVRRSLLESVQGEVEAVTGGRRMAEIMDVVAGELDKLITTRGPKAGGRYDVAIRERDRLATEEATLSAEVKALREALDKRTSAMKRLSELENPAEREERRQHVNAAQAAFDAARAHSERLRTAEAELNLARERKTATERELAAFETSSAKAADLVALMQAADVRRRETSLRRRKVSEAIEQARVALDAAEAGEQEARDLIARLESAAKTREAAERLSGLKERLQKADAARASIEEQAAQLSLNKVSAQAVDELHTLEIEITRLHATADAGRPSLSIAYASDAAPRIALDGVPLDDGEERAYGERAELFIEGVGTVSLHSRRPARGDKELQSAQERRKYLLDTCGVTSLAEARKHLAIAQQSEASLRELRSRLSLLAPEGLPMLRAEVAQLEDKAQQSAPELKADPEQAREQLATAEEARKAARQALREIEPQRDRAEKLFIEAETAWAALNADLTQVDAMLGPAEERDTRKQKLIQALQASTERLGEAGELVQALRASATDLDATSASLQRARSVHDAAEQEINRLRETIAGLNATISVQSDEAVEEAWRETKDKLDAANARVASFEKEVAVLKRLASALEAARTEARDLYLKPVMTELKPLLGLLFDDVSITFDDRTLLPQRILRNGQEEDVDRLSGGMREQLSVLTRLAFARLLARDGRPAPVILDDALVYSDDDRIEKMFDALHRQSREQQIIVFSCRQRAFQRLGGNVLEMTDWQP